MKGNLGTCLLLCWLPLGAAGQPGAWFQSGARTAKPEKMPEPRGDVLEFVDGSILHGSLNRMDLDHGLTWAKPEAGNPICFNPSHFDFIRFARAQSVSQTPTCHLWFANGDDLYGSITLLDDQRLGFNTWFASTMLIPRAAIRAITFLSSNYSIVYEGPYDLGGWTVANKDSWSFHDGLFVGSGPGALGRDLNLTRSTTVEFDLAWSALFSLQVGIYCNDLTDRRNLNSEPCVVNVTPSQVSLRQAGNMTFNLPAEPLPGGEGKGRMRVAIECDKTQGTISVFINHLLAKTWKNCSFAGGGTGILFRQNLFIQSAGFASAPIQLGHLKISQWEDRGEPQTASPATNSDAIQCVNHDRAAGIIQSIQNGKARLAVAGTAVDIPLERVARVEFAQAAPPADSPGPWLVRAHFPGGGNLSFQLQKWDGQGISGRSAIFGSLAFQPGAIRELEFNLNRPAGRGIPADSREFEDLDE
jgi:hypothetical protein